MHTLTLNGPWKLYAFPAEPQKMPIEDVIKLEALPATVPGNVEFSLIAAGLLPEDIFRGDNILKVQDFETWDYVYERTFSLTSQELTKKWRLVFEGVDCIADYYLNGELIGHSENALIAHTFEVDNLESENVLRVYLRSSVYSASLENYPTYGLYHSYVHSCEQLRLRKPASCFGWDIMCRAVSAGLWREVRLEEVRETELEDLYIATSVIEEDQAILTAHYKIRTIPAKMKKLSMRIEGRCGEHTFSLEQRLRFPFGFVTIYVKDPALWWPCGYGDANLYDTTVTLMADGEVVDVRKVNVGIRTIKLDRHVNVDYWGQKTGYNDFRFIVNGEPIFCKGSNWVPLDAFHSRDYADGRLDRAMAMLHDLNCNIVRCWGGNVYEDHAFFDLCDKYGILVWQDFGMACGFYPEDDDFIAVMKEEVTAVIHKLRGHASLALWCGDNECDHYDFEPARNKLTREVFPAIIRMEDPFHPYIASSPDLTDRKPGVMDVSGLSSEQHIWGPRDHFKADCYTQHDARFVSETGYHGCNSLESMRRFLSEDQVWPWNGSHEWLTHSSDPGDGWWSHRIAMMHKQARQTFGYVPEKAEDFVFASQFTQAEAKKFFIEKMRMGKWERTGIIWWNLIDGWPQFSDAIVDYYFDVKLAYNHIKRSQQDVVLCMGEINAWNAPLIVVNDTFTARAGTYAVTDAESGEVLSEGSFKVGANESREIASLPLFYSEKRMLLLRLDFDGKTVWNHHIFGEVPYDLERAKLWQSIIDKLPW